MHDGEVQREKLVCDGNLGHVEFEMTQCTLMESSSVSMVLKVCTRVKDWGVSKSPNCNSSTRSSAIMEFDRISKLWFHLSYSRNFFCTSLFFIHSLPSSIYFVFKKLLWLWSYQLEFWVIVLTMSQLCKSVQVLYGLWKLGFYYVKRQWSFTGLINSKMK